MSMGDIIHKLCKSTYCINMVEEHSEYCPRCIRDGVSTIVTNQDMGWGESAMKEPKTVTLSSPLYLFAMFSDNVFQGYMTLANRYNVPQGNEFLRYDYMGLIKEVHEE